MPDLVVVAHPIVNRGFILRISSIAALGGVLYGYDMGIIAAAAIFVKRSFALSTLMEELVVSIVLIGAMVGALVGGMVADRIGRRATLVWAAGIFIVGSLLAPLAANVAVLIVARAIIGIGIGFTSVTAPVYVSELAPPQSRGMLDWALPVRINPGNRPRKSCGLLACRATGMATHVRHCCRAPSVLFLAVILTVLESPRCFCACASEGGRRFCAAIQMKLERNSFSPISKKDSRRQWNRAGEPFGVRPCEVLSSSRLD